MLESCSNITIYTVRTAIGGCFKKTALKVLAWSQRSQKCEVIRSGEALETYLCFKTLKINLFLQHKLQWYSERALEATALASITEKKMSIYSIYLISLLRLLWTYYQMRIEANFIEYRRFNYKLGVYRDKYTNLLLYLLQYRQPCISLLAVSLYTLPILLI